HCIDGHRSEVDATEELCVEGDDDGRHAHEHRADGGREGEAGPGESAGGEGDGQDVVAGGPGEVLELLAVAGLGQPDHRGDAARVAAGQDDPGRLDGDIGACPDGETDIGASERGGVVHAVANHRHGEPPGLELGNFGVLVL